MATKRGGSGRRRSILKFNPTEPVNEEPEVTNQQVVMNTTVTINARKRVSFGHAKIKEYQNYSTSDSSQDGSYHSQGNSIKSINMDTTMLDDEMDLESSAEAELNLNKTFTKPNLPRPYDHNYSFSANKTKVDGVDMDISSSDVSILAEQHLDNQSSEVTSREGPACNHDDGNGNTYPLPITEIKRNVAVASSTLHQQLAGLQVGENTEVAEKENRVYNPKPPTTLHIQVLPQKRRTDTSMFRKPRIFHSQPGGGKQGAKAKLPPAVFSNIKTPKRNTQNVEEESFCIDLLASNNSNGSSDKSEELQTTSTPEMVQPRVVSQDPIPISSKNLELLLPSASKASIVSSSKQCVNESAPLVSTSTDVLTVVPNEVQLDYMEPGTRETNCNIVAVEPVSTVAMEPSNNLLSNDKEVINKMAHILSESENKPSHPAFNEIVGVNLNTNQGSDAIEVVAIPNQTNSNSTVTIPGNNGNRPPFVGIQVDTNDNHSAHVTSTSGDNIQERADLDKSNSVSDKPNYQHIPKEAIDVDTDSTMSQRSKSVPLTSRSKSKTDYQLDCPRVLSLLEKLYRCEPFQILSVCADIEEILMGMQHEDFERFKKEHAHKVPHNVWVNIERCRPKGASRCDSPGYLTLRQFNELFRLMQKF